MQPTIDQWIPKVGDWVTAAIHPEDGNPLTFRAVVIAVNLGEGILRVRDPRDSPAIRVDQVHDPMFIVEAPAYWVRIEDAHPLFPEDIAGLEPRLIPRTYTPQTDPGFWNPSPDAVRFLGLDQHHDHRIPYEIPDPNRAPREAPTVSDWLAVGAMFLVGCVMAAALVYALPRAAYWLAHYLGAI